MHRFRLRLDAAPHELTLIIALREYLVDLADDIPAVMARPLAAELERKSQQDGTDALEALFPDGAGGWDVSVHDDDIYLVDAQDRGNIRVVALVLQHLAPSALPCAASYTDAKGHLHSIMIGTASREVH